MKENKGFSTVHNLLAVKSIFHITFVIFVSFLGFLFCFVLNHGVCFVCFSSCQLCALNINTPTNGLNYPLANLEMSESGLHSMCCL